MQLLHSQWTLVLSVALGASSGVAAPRAPAVAAAAAALQVYYSTDSTRDLSRQFGDVLYKIHDLEVRPPEALARRHTIGMPSRAFHPLPRPCARLTPHEAARES